MISDCFHVFTFFINALMVFVKIFRLIKLIHIERRDERSVDKIKRIIGYELRDGFEFSSMKLDVCGFF